MLRDTSLAAFENLLASGQLTGLKLAVYRAICDIGPVHNLRLLEYLQQKERVDNKPANRIDWTRSNCWPRVTELVAGGCVVDAGAYHLNWLGRNKTLHIWYVASAKTEIPKQWKKIERKIKSRPAPVEPAEPIAWVSSASQAGRVLQACRHKKPIQKSAQGMLFPTG